LLPRLSNVQNEPVTEFGTSGGSTIAQYAKQQQLALNERANQMSNAEAQKAQQPHGASAGLKKVHHEGSFKLSRHSPSMSIYAKKSQEMQNYYLRNSY
jgi:hypothetical protein